VKVIKISKHATLHMEIHQQKGEGKELKWQSNYHILPSRTRWIV